MLILPRVLSPEECWVRLAAGSLARPQMSGGYTDKLTDVEHSAEETGDPLTSILLIGMVRCGTPEK